MLMTAWDHKEKYPDLRVRMDFSDKHWHELQLMVNHNALFALPTMIGCPGCVDEVVESLEVKFSDRTSKSVGYNEGNAPGEIKALTEKLHALETKLANEIPPWRLHR